MSEQQNPEVAKQIVAAALNNPHQLFLVDRILRADVNAFTSVVTLGNTLPNGQITAVATFSTSTQNLRNFAESILAQIEAQGASIKADLAAFSATLPSDSELAAGG